jgi:hypothetical protein
MYKHHKHVDLFDTSRPTTSFDTITEAAITTTPALCSICGWPCDGSAGIVGIGNACNDCLDLWRDDYQVVSDDSGKTWYWDYDRETIVAHQS